MTESKKRGIKFLTWYNVPTLTNLFSEMDAQMHANMTNASWVSFQRLMSTEHPGDKGIGTLENEVYSKVVRSEGISRSLSAALSFIQG